MCWALGGGGGRGHRAIPSFSQITTLVSKPGTLAAEDKLFIALFNSCGPCERRITPASYQSNETVEHASTL